MESPKSLKLTTGVLIFFLVISAVNRVDNLYIPLKQSIVGQRIPELTIYASELVTFLLFGTALVKVVKNISKQLFFTKANINCFRLMSLSMMLPPVVKTAGRLFDSAHDWAAYPMAIELWGTAALFMALMSHIFEYGLKLKEEQDLTV